MIVRRQCPLQIDKSKSTHFNLFKASQTKHFNIQKKLSFINPTPQKILENSYSVSNETNWGMVLNTLSKMTPKENNINYMHSSILTGESHFLSILPYLIKHSKTIFFNDVDLDVHKHVRLQYQLIVRSKQKNEFIEKYYQALKTNLFDDLAESPYYFDRYLREQSDMLGEYYFLNSDQHYQFAQTAAKKIQIFYSHFDWYNASQVKQFSEILKFHEFKIMFCNISNLSDYDESNSLSNSLFELSTLNSFTVLHSKLLDNKVRAFAPITVEEYQEYKQLLIRRSPK